MTIKEMHYDFKKKLNKIDSQQNRNLLIPEIDWLLNEAQRIFVKLVAEPRLKSHLGFEISQRNIDDIRTLVTNKCLDIHNNVISLPIDYWYFIKAVIQVKKNNCVSKARLYIRQHDDEFENNPFYKSSFEWREVNGLFNNKGIKVFDDGTFINEKIYLDYIKKPKYIHNAEDFRKDGYKLPSGLLLTNIQDSELPDSTHDEIVDIAVYLASSEMMDDSIQSKLNKLSLNQLK